MAALAYIIFTLIDLFLFVLIVTIIMSWLVAFNVINRHNRFVSAVLQICYAITEPVLRPVRNLLPSVGGLDLSPIVVFIGLRALEIFLRSYVFGPMIARGF